MALTKITGGVVSTTSDYQVGVLTATKFIGDGSGLTGVASTDNIVTSTPAEFNNTVDINGQLNVDNINCSGVVTATTFNGTFTGDGSALTGVGGLGDPSGNVNNLNYLFTSPELLEITGNATISATEAQGNIVFTASDSIKVATGVTVTVAAGTTIRTNVLNLY